MLAAPPPPPLDVAHFDFAQLYRVRRNASSTDDDEDDPQSESPPPGSPVQSSLTTRTASWKRKRTNSTGSVKLAEIILAETTVPECAQLESQRAKAAEALRVELEEMRGKLEEAERLLALMACEAPKARAVSCSAPLPPTLTVECSAICLDASECSICLETIQQAAVGSCLCHFCLPCLTTSVANGLDACPKCRTPIREVRRDPEFDRILWPATLEMPVDEDEATPPYVEMAPASKPACARRPSFARRAAAKLGFMPSSSLAPAEVARDHLAGEKRLTRPTHRRSLSGPS